MGADMNVRAGIEKLFHRVVDDIYARRTQPRPSRQRLQDAKIVSHRGEHVGTELRENTLAAFDRAVAGGVWGIEFDVRWTKDLQPVVCHDPNLRRVFGLCLEIRHTALADLRTACPLVPTLAEVVDRYGRRVHLMIEVKEEPYPDPVRQNRILRGLLQSVRPQTDFHVLSLAPRMLDLIEVVPKTACMPVARLNLSRLSRLVVRERMAAVAGHYLFVTPKTIRRHHLLGQRVATGYIRSQNCLFREINRGVDWIFSNHAAGLQAIANANLGSS